MEELRIYCNFKNYVKLNLNGEEIPVTEVAQVDEQKLTNYKDFTVYLESHYAGVPSALYAHFATTTAFNRHWQKVANFKRKVTVMIEETNTVMVVNP